MIKEKKKLSFSKYLIKSQSQSLRRDSTKTQIRWENCQGNVCKLIINPNRCFCKHSLEQHNQKDNFRCIVEKCGCTSFQYVPYFDIKCLCRHSYKDHDKISRKCKMCNKCLGFLTSWSCKCGFKFDQHKTILPKQNLDQSTRLIKKQTKNKQTYIVKNKQNIIKNDKLPHINDSKGLQIIQNFQTIFNQNQRYINQDRKKKNTLERINRKYAKLNDYIENDFTLNFSEKLQPISNYDINGLDLFMKPHNYRYINIEKLVQHEYKKNKINLYNRIN